MIQLRLYYFERSLLWHFSSYPSKLLLAFSILKFGLEIHHKEPFLFHQLKEPEIRVLVIFRLPKLPKDVQNYRIIVSEKYSLHLGHSTHQSLQINYKLLNPKKVHQKKNLG